MRAANAAFSLAGRALAEFSLVRDFLLDGGRNRLRPIITKGLSRRPHGGDNDLKAVLNKISFVRQF